MKKQIRKTLTLETFWNLYFVCNTKKFIWYVLEEKFMVMIDHPALINYNKTKLTEQWTSWDRQQVIVMVLMMMLKIDLSLKPCTACSKEKMRRYFFILFVWDVWGMKKIFFSTWVEFIQISSIQKFNSYCLSKLKNIYSYRILCIKVWKIC